LVLAENLRSEETERLLIKRAKEIKSSSSSSAISAFVFELFDYLGMVESCPEQLFQVLLDLLYREELYSKKAFGELLMELSDSSFLFSETQKRAISATVEKQYPFMEFDLKRMMFLVILISYLDINSLSRVLIKLYSDASEVGNPVAELVWELSALKNEVLLDEAARSEISEIISELQ
jgi:hypothetical protein